MEMKRPGYLVKYSAASYPWEMVDTSFGRLHTHLVVFVGHPLHVIQSWILRPVEAWHQHLRQADIFRPGDGAMLILPEFVNSKMRTNTTHARIAQNCPEFSSRVSGETPEAEIGIAYWR